eukprot:1122674-Rhodomonas_salina.1
MSVLCARGLTQGPAQWLFTQAHARIRTADSDSSLPTGAESACGFGLETRRPVTCSRSCTLQRLEGQRSLGGVCKVPLAW